MPRVQHLYPTRGNICIYGNTHGNWFDFGLVCWSEIRSGKQQSIDCHYLWMKWGECITEQCSVYLICMVCISYVYACTGSMRVTWHTFLPMVSHCYAHQQLLVMRQEQEQFANKMQGWRMQAKQGCKCAIRFLCILYDDQASVVVQRIIKHGLESWTESAPNSTSTKGYTLIHLWKVPSILYELSTF